MDSIMNYIIERIIILPGILVGLSFHEFGHAWMSARLGDPTPRLQGRVTLNPAAHIDVIGFASLLLLGFGWGKPVQVDPRYYRHKRRDELMVALAGVTINFFIALAGAALMKLFYTTGSAFLATSIGGIIWRILVGLVQINLVLMIFNLIPLPPLDGFGVITQLFHLDTKSWYARFCQLGPMILLIAIVLNLTSYIISPAVSALYLFILNLFF